SLYPANSVPAVVRRINNALMRADEISRVEGDTSVENWLLPIVADGEAGFGGALNVYELQKAMIQAGAAGTHWEDQLASEKKCGHLGGKVLIPTQQHIRTLTSARLAADVANVPTVVTARTHAEAAAPRTSDGHERDQKLIDAERPARPRRCRGRAPRRLRRRWARPEVHRGRPPRRGLLPREERHRALHRARQVLRPVLRPHLDGDRHPGPRGRQAVRRGRQVRVPGPAAVLQLLPVLQLVRAPGGRRDRQVPERAGQDGLQVPVHHPGRLPRPELRHV